MKFRHTTSSGNDKVELQMTPMIDIVFQLLAFFIMSFRIGAQEGDFNVKMPMVTPAPGPPSQVALPPIRVRLKADSAGRLTGVQFNDRMMPASGGMEALRLEIIGLIGDDRGPGSIQESAEVELDCDFQLHYEHVIQAVTAVSGYRDRDGNVIKLVEKIKFAPPRAG
jgi:biopolymer transport protein ExbD